MQALAISTKVDQVCPGKLDKNLNKQGLKNNVVIAINPKLWKSRGVALPNLRIQAIVQQNAVLYISRDYACASTEFCE
ncbi:hypothetical protein F443_20569 [Phytophthora nicotianae P1569]|uniref:Uncharacterized protein n=1 Tax=Phytophthora nicotianae P1569 TaxID=1317065 RepID=V9E2Y2_PHYNI|nr:hypothetical protein F443_20569 [Phytophthora nicotianae P1569]